MESVRWVLAAAGVEFDEDFLETKEQLQKLQDGNHLLFQQVPMVEIDGMKLVQTRSILHYIADKHHLFGKDLKERTLYCGPSGVFSLVHLPMRNRLVVLYSTPVHFMSCIVSGNREQSPRKVKTS